MIQILAKPVVEKIQNEVKERVAAFKSRSGRAPKLSVVLVGENPGSVIYTRRKGEAAVSVGMLHESITLPWESSPAEIKAVVDRLNADRTVDGILIQRPLPPACKEEEVVYWVSPEKDVDAFHPENTGRLVLGLPCFQPCTPKGVMTLLQYYQIPVAGKLACIIGRSSIVGKPMASLLLQADATVLHCHSRTPDLRSIAKQADILVAAIGRPKFVDAHFVKKGAAVIDVGINRDENKKVVGDVDYDAVSSNVSAITPVPGGVGPMTIAILLQNTVMAAELRG